MTSNRPHTPRRLAKKSAEDLEANARIRAHLRQQIKDRGIDPAELARRIRVNDGNFSRQMAGSRGFSVGQVLRICRSLGFTATRLLEEDPPARFFDDPGAGSGDT
jgi:hypothetical protein